ncbi:MAG: hypothetical protein SFZ23_13775 [Planctomycetota bacterium]|nr:hypothetical protein [Planctomycetota bacterium]
MPDRAAELRPGSPASPGTSGSPALRRRPGARGVVAARGGSLARVMALGVVAASGLLASRGEAQPAPMASWRLGPTITPSAPPDGSEADWTAARATLTDEGAARDVRSAAATQLVRALDHRPNLDAIVTILRAPLPSSGGERGAGAAGNGANGSNGPSTSGPSGAGASGAGQSVVGGAAPSALSLVLEAIAREPVAHPALLEPLAELVTRLPEPMLQDALRALGSIRTIPAARVLLTYADEQLPTAVTTAAFQSLERLTGRDDLPRSSGAWRAWGDRIARMTSHEWSAELARGLAGRTDRARAALRARTAALVDARRQVYLTTPQAPARNELLRSFLAEGLPEMRDLAFELIGRELGAGSRLDPALGTLVTSLIRHPDAPVRERAVQLANQLTPDEARESILALLPEESDPRVAAALLQAATRWPREVNPQIALTWVSRPGPVRTAAIDLLWAIARAGELNDPADRELTLTLLRDLPDEAHTPASCRLLFVMGTRSDETILLRLLTAPGATTRLAAAEAVVNDRGFFDALLAAAGRDSQLFDVATRSLIIHAPDLAGFRTLTNLPVDSPEDRRRGVATLARHMPSTDLLFAALGPAIEGVSRELILSPMTSEERVLTERGSPRQLEALAQGLLILARLRIEAERPEATLAALAALPELDRLIPGEADKLRVAALVLLRRFDQASAFDVDAEVWLETLERARDPELAAAIAQEISRQFDRVLTEDQRDRLALLVASRAAMKADAAPAPTESTPARPEPNPTPPPTPGPPSATASDGSPAAPRDGNPSGARGG